MAKSSSIPSHSSPSNLGYRLPAEWEHHQATWMTWPQKSHFSGSDRSSLLAHARSVFGQIVRALAPSEVVYVNVPDANSERAVIKFLGTSHPNLRFCPIVTSSCWCRDYSPSYVCRRDAQWRTPPLVAIDWEYDEVFPMAAARLLGIPCISGGMALYGGDVETNGLGTVLTAEGALLGRNPDFRKRRIADRLKAMLGAIDVYWLVDRSMESALPVASKRVGQLARFVADDVVVVSSPTASSPEVVPGSSEMSFRQNLSRLAAKQSGGKKIEVVSLPPVPSKNPLACYTDFYVANELVLMPAFGISTDSEVRDRLASFFTGRQIFDVKCDSNVGKGWIHPMVQHIPAFELDPR